MWPGFLNDDLGLRRGAVVSAEDLTKKLGANEEEL